MKIIIRHKNLERRVTGDFEIKFTEVEEVRHLFEVLKEYVESSRYLDDGTLVVSSINGVKRLNWDE